MQEYKLFINGEWIRSSSGKTFEDINPATLETIGELQKASLDDVKSAVDSADDAFEKWSATPARSVQRYFSGRQGGLKNEKKKPASDTLLLSIELDKILEKSISNK